MKITVSWADNNIPMTTEEAALEVATNLPSATLITDDNVTIVTRYFESGTMLRFDTAYHTIDLSNGWFAKPQDPCGLVLTGPDGEQFELNGAQTKRLREMML